GFGIEPFESYGSSEGGLNFVRSADTPEDALGLPPAGTAYTAAVIDPVDMSERPRARFGEHGELLNADEAIGELAALGARGTFEGYYKDPEAESERLRGDNFLSGDLGYRDEAGYFYFAGRGGDRLRVDGENFSGAPIERIIGRYPDAQLAAIYPVPDEISGDQVMLALQMADGRTFDPVGFGAFLDAQADLGTKWAPRYIRIVDTLPVTATAKINKKELRKDAWRTDEPVYYRPGKGIEYHRLESAHMEELLRRCEDFGRQELVNRSLSPTNRESIPKGQHAGSRSSSRKGGPGTTALATGCPRRRSAHCSTCWATATPSTPMKQRPSGTGTTVSSLRRRRCRCGR